MYALLSKAEHHSGAAVLPAASAVWFGGFALFFGGLIALDMWLNRKHETPSVRKSALQTLFFVSMGLAVGVWLLTTHYGSVGASQYFAAYLTEWSLSVDNIFVISLILAQFTVPREYFHRVLLWGILGAFVFRLVFILLGVAVITKFEITTLFLGAFLVYTAIKLMRSDDSEQDVSQMRSYRIISKILPATSRFYGSAFFVRHGSSLQFMSFSVPMVLVTPLLVCVCVIEITDLVFALDSVPAVLSITPNQFIAFTSNAMAILGLRSVFFLYSHIEDKISRLNEGVAIILAFVGVKMIIANEIFMGWLGLDSIHVPTFLGLAVIVACLAGSIVASLIWPKTDEVDISDNVVTDETLVEVYVDAGHTMDGEWTKGLVAKYLDQLVEALRRWDSDGTVPAYAFANTVESLGDIMPGELAASVLARPDLGSGCDLATVLRHAAGTARTTSGKFIFAVLTDGRVDDERAAREVFVTMPDNCFVLFVRVSDEPGGAEFLQGLDDYNVGNADRCDTIHATNDDGQPKEDISEVIGREIEDWLKRAPVNA